nr:hypothetical protein [Tanacetum cinerariifolium]
MIIVAWNGDGNPTTMFDYDVFKKVLNVFITASILKLGQGEILGLSKQDGEEIKRCDINYLDIFTSYYKTAKVPKEEHNTILSMPTGTVKKEAVSKKGKEKMKHFRIKLEDTRYEPDSLSPIHPSIKGIQTMNKDNQGMIKRPIKSEFKVKEETNNNSSEGLEIQTIRPCISSLLAFRPIPELGSLDSYIRLIKSEKPAVLFIVAIVAYLLPNMLVVVLFLFPFIRLYLESSNYRVVMLMMWWSQPRLYVGGMHESTFSFQVHDLLDFANCNKAGIQLLFRGSVLIYKAFCESDKSYHECSYQYLHMARVLPQDSNSCCVALRFESLPGAFNGCLIPPEKSKVKKKGLKDTVLSVRCGRFAQLWNKIITSFREEDLINNREINLLLVPYWADTDLDLIQWPTFLLASMAGIGRDCVGVIVSIWTRFYPLLWYKDLPSLKQLIQERTTPDPCLSPHPDKSSHLAIDVEKGMNLELFALVLVVSKKTQPPEVIDRANQLLKMGSGTYYVILNNCKDFALYCKTSYTLNGGVVCGDIIIQNDAVKTQVKDLSAWRKKNEKMLPKYCKNRMKATSNPSGIVLDIVIRAASFGYCFMMQYVEASITSWNLGRIVISVDDKNGCRGYNGFRFHHLSGV